MRIVGIDPGVTGAMALIDSSGPKLIQAINLPIVDIDGSMAVVDEDGVVNAITEWNPDAVCIERQGPIYDPKRGIRMTGSSVCKLAMVTGSIIAICRLSSRPMHYLTPAVWKRLMSLTKKPKEAALDRANSLFPGHPDLFYRRGRVDRRVVIARAEAALIAWALWLRVFAQRVAA